MAGRAVGVLPKPPLAVLNEVRRFVGILRSLNIRDQTQQKQTFADLVWPVMNGEPFSKGLARLNPQFRHVQLPELEGALRMAKDQLGITDKGMLEDGTFLQPLMGLAEEMGFLKQ